MLENKFIPPKVCFVLWAAMHASIPTRDMLQRRGMVIPSADCLFCNAVETLEHLFVNCSWVQLIWNYFISSMQVMWVMPRTFHSILLNWGILRTTKRRRIVWQILPFAICWELWLERNKRVHGGRTRSKNEVIYVVKLDICLWSSDTDIFKGYSVNQSLHNWEDIVVL